MRLRILLSYWYYAKLNVAGVARDQFGDPEPEFFADSGAFSAMTQGGSVNLEEYAIWLEMWKDHLTAYANLDVIGEPEQTARNQKFLEDKGLTPLPVFHGGSPWEELHRLCETYPYIAIGGVVGRAKNPMGWMVRCHKVARQHGTVLHGFGITSWDALKAFPWYSVDSSSWAQGFRFGLIPLFDERRGEWKRVTLKDKQTPFKHGDLLRRYGVQPQVIADLPKKAPNRTLLAGLAALAYLKAEAWLRAFHGPVSLPDREDGLKTYMAAARPDSKTKIHGQLAAAQEGLKLYMADTSDGCKDTLMVKTYYESLRDQPGVRMHIVDGSIDNLKRAHQFV